MAFYDPTTYRQQMRLPCDVVFALGAVLMALDFVLKLRALLRRLADEVRQ
ncbi:MAG: hypothetical protein KGM97_08305 [Alphaproteobacteria bacterium]|nr:hypothetical protein [Alphaproteobacteria bacterium]MDE2630977.1 hypothetical protein [Alphaproteobacteria bacterium]